MDDQEPVAVAVVAAAEAGDDAEQLALVDDEHSEADVAVSVCSTLWCYFEQTQVAESAAFPGQNVFPVHSSVQFGHL